MLLSALGEGQLFFGKRQPRDLAARPREIKTQAPQL